MKIVLVHGFNVKDGGRNTVDKLIPFIRSAGHVVDKDEGDYGFFNIWMIRLFKSYLKSRVLYRLARAFETADVIITHSNGAHFTTQALDMMGAEYNNTKVVIHISPALNAKTPIPNAVKGMRILYTKHDFWVKLSSFIPWHPWGRMGAVGYKGKDNKGSSVSNHAVKKHSNWFTDKWSATTWGYCNTYITEMK